jgi:hypothetical protein
MIHDDRKSWLNGVAAGMGAAVRGVGRPLLDGIRVTIGFTSATRRSRTIGECWDNRRGADANLEIFIRRDLAHALDAMLAQIAAILAHELVYVMVGIKGGHGTPFERVALGRGLVGSMRATTPGGAFLAEVAPILVAAGLLPHARFDTGGLTTARPTRRSLKRGKPPWFLSWLRKPGTRRLMNPSGLLNRPA